MINTLSDKTKTALIAFSTAVFCLLGSIGAMTNVARADEVPLLGDSAYTEYEYHLMDDDVAEDPSAKTYITVYRKTFSEPSPGQSEPVVGLMPWKWAEGTFGAYTLLLDPGDPDEIEGYAFTGWKMKYTVVERVDDDPDNDIWHEYGPVDVEFGVTTVPQADYVYLEPTYEQVVVTHTVTFYDSHRTGTVPQISQEIVHGETATRPEDPYYYGYTFLGWYLEDVAYDFSTPVTSDVWLSARFSANTYTITFALNGYLPVRAEFFTKLEEPPAPEKTGYKFLGWYSSLEDNRKWDFQTDVVTGDVTLYPAWQAENKPTIEEETEKDLLDRAYDKIGYSDLTRTGEIILAIAAVVTVIVLIRIVKK